MSKSVTRPPAKPEACNCEPLKAVDLWATSKVAAWLFEQTQLVYAAVFFFLIADIFPDRLFITTDGGNMVASGPKLLPGEVAPASQIIASYMNSAFTFDEPDHLGH